MYSPYEFGQMMAGFCDAVRANAPSSPFDGVPNQLAQILQELKKMSDTQNAEQADVAQMTADLSSLAGAFKSLTDKVAALQATAAASPSVPADLQAQINALHSFAQSVAPPAAATESTATQPSTDPAPSTTAPESTSATPPATTTAEPAPVTTAPAETDTPAV